MTYQFQASIWLPRQVASRSCPFWVTHFVYDYYCNVVLALLIIVQRRRYHWCSMCTTFRGLL